MSGSLKDVCLSLLKLGALGFGGPIALAGYMHRDLVEERKWITPDDYQEGLALAQSLRDQWPRSSRCTSAG